MLTSWSVGNTVHFGSHSLLSNHELETLHRMLECKKCRFRRLYLQLASVEHRCTRKRVSRSICYRSIPFHNVTRAIKAVLRGFKLDEKETVRFHIEATIHCFSSLPNSYPNKLYGTVLHAKPQYWVCPSHGRQLFEMMYVDDAVHASSNTVDDSIGTCCIVPQGHSEFVRNVEQSSSSDDEDDDDIPSITVKISYTPSIHLLDICNSRSKSGFSKRNVFNEAKGNSPRDSNTKQSVSNPTSRRVHFPDGNPVSAVHNLLVFATASKLERRDRIWEMAANRRQFEHLRRLVTGNRNLDGTSSDDDDEACDVSGSTCSIFSSSDPTSVSHGSPSNPVEDAGVVYSTTQIRRRRRNRRRRRQRLANSCKVTFPIACGNESNTDHNRLYTVHNKQIDPLKFV